MTSCVVVVTLTGDAAAAAVVDVVAADDMPLLAQSVATISICHCLSEQVTQPLQWRHKRATAK